MCDRKRSMAHHTTRNDACVPAGGRWPATAGKREACQGEEVGRLGDARYDVGCHPQFPRRKATPGAPGSSKMNRLFLFDLYISLGNEADPSFGF